jgi:hypothetical protein
VESNDDENNLLSVSFILYENSILEFQEYCNQAYDIVNKMTDSLSSIELKESNYLRTKIKKRNPDIRLRKLDSGNESLLVIMKKYETLQLLVLKNKERYSEAYQMSEIRSRTKLKKFYGQRPRLITMTYITNSLMYDRTILYLEGKFDNSIKKLRKIEMPLLKIATKATTKTSPLWFHNKVSAISQNIYNFKFEINKPQITPNYVFFHRLYEELILKVYNLPFIKFKVTKKMTESAGFLYVFRNDSDNYKIHRAKDVLAKVPTNSVFGKLIQLHDQEITVKYIIENFEMEQAEASLFVIKLFHLGILTLATELKEGFFINKNLQEFIKKLPDHPFNDQIYDYLKELEQLLVLINEKFNVDLLRKIYSLYDTICDFANLEKIEKKLMLYGDYIKNAPDQEKCVSNLNVSEHMLELLRVFPIFDINQMIKYEFAYEVTKILGKVELSINHPLLMKILTDVNLKYASYWSNPWGRIESDMQKNQLINELKTKFIGWLYEHQNVKELNIEEIISQLSQDVKNNNLETDAYYTIFYQKENEKTVVNKIYPGYGSFYQRFLRYTNIMEKYGDVIEKFYESEQWSYAEILETLGFNANITEAPYFKTRYRDKETRGDMYNQYFEQILDENGAEIRMKDNDIYLHFKDELKIKPVIVSSLIRALYPGRLAFLSSLFTSISFIQDMGILFFNWSDGKIRRTPRIVYKDIILERAGVLIDCSEFETFFDADELRQYQLIRRFIQANIGECFYYHQRKTKIGKISSIATEFAKPQYCDINDVLHYKLLINSFKDTEQILFKEPVPIDYSLAEYVQEVSVFGK